MATKGGRPARYVGKRTRSYTLTDEAHNTARVGAVAANVTASDLVETLIRRHTLEAVQYLKGDTDADTTAGHAGQPATPTDLSNDQR